MFKQTICAIALAATLMLAGNATAQDFSPKLARGINAPLCGFVAARTEPRPPVAAGSYESDGASLSARFRTI